MFKHAYVRGIQSALINSGAAFFPDETAAIKVADYIADRIELDPLGAVPPATAMKVAQDLVQASDWFKSQPNFKAASFQKLATWEDVRALGEQHAVQLMQKAAEGSTIEGGDKGNKEPTTGEGKMDLKDRPDGYAENSLGKTDVDVRPGQVGKEQDQPNKPTESPSGSNSVTEQSRTASITDLFRKAAEGSTILGGDKGNKEPTTGEGKMDLAARPEGYARLPHQGAPGALPGMATGSAIVGKEVAHPSGPSESPSGSNSLTAHSGKTGSEDPFLALFKKTASEIVQFLPESMEETTKIAHVRACMGLTIDEKANYLARFQPEPKTAAPAWQGYDGRNANQRKAANDMPPFMKKDDDDKAEKKDDDKKDNLPPWMQGKSDEKKDEKSDEEKKEAAMRDTVGRIAAALRSAS